MIRIEHVYKAFGDKVVLADANLCVRPGENMVVIGGSGTGKSVLLKHIIGLLKPDKGDVFIEGKSIGDMTGDEMNEMRRKFGMLFQFGALFDSLTVWENVGFGMLVRERKKKKEILKYVRECLALVGLPGTEFLQPAELSGGMRKRVALARAIALKPKIMLYDEPTTGLDPIMSDAINNLILDMNERFNVTSLTITHDMASAYKIADRIAMLFDGKIIFVGTPDEVKTTDNSYVRQFVEGRAEGPITTTRL